MLLLKEKYKIEILLGMCIYLALTTTLAANSVLKIFTPLAHFAYLFQQTEEKSCKIEIMSDPHDSSG